MSEARKHLGFCPQVDPLIDLMTGRETLHMFGRLRGIPQRKLVRTHHQLSDLQCLYFFTNLKFFLSFSIVRMKVSKNF